MDTTPPSAATVTASSVAREQLAGEAAAAVGLRAAGAHARAPADEAAEVLGLGERALGPGRGDLERVALAHVGEVAR